MSEVLVINTTARFLPSVIICRPEEQACRQVRQASHIGWVHGEKAKRVGIQIEKGYLERVKNCWIEYKHKSLFVSRALLGGFVIPRNIDGSIVNRTKRDQVQEQEDQGGSGRNKKGGGGDGQDESSDLSDTSTSETD